MLSASTYLVPLCCVHLIGATIISAWIPAMVPKELCLPYAAFILFSPQQPQWPWKMFPYHSLPLPQCTLHGLFFQVLCAKVILSAFLNYPIYLYQHLSTTLLCIFTQLNFSSDIFIWQIDTHTYIYIYMHVYFLPLSANTLPLTFTTLSLTPRIVPTSKQIYKYLLNEWMNKWTNDPTAEVLE
jgi:hypothetical protein